MKPNGQGNATANKAPEMIGESERRHNLPVDVQCMRLSHAGKSSPIRKYRIFRALITRSELKTA